MQEWGQKENEKNDESKRDCVGIKAQSRWPNHKRTYRLYSPSPLLPPSLFLHYLLFDVLLITSHTLIQLLVLWVTILPISKWLSML